MKFTVTLQKHVVEEYVVEAESAEDAEALAEQAADRNDVSDIVRRSAFVDRESLVVLEVEEDIVARVDE